MEGQDKIIIAEKDNFSIDILRNILSKLGREGKFVNDINELFDELQDLSKNILIIDLEPKELEYIDILKKINPDLKIIVASSGDSIDLEMLLREKGIFYYCLKPYDSEEIKMVLESALECKEWEEFLESIH